MAPRSRIFTFSFGSSSSSCMTATSSSPFLSTTSLRSFSVSRIGFRCVVVCCNCMLAVERVCWSSFIRLYIEESAEPMFVTSSGWTWPLIHMHPSQKSSTLMSFWLPWTEATSANTTLMSSSWTPARSKNWAMESALAPRSASNVDFLPFLGVLLVMVEAGEGSSSSAKTSVVSLYHSSSCSLETMGEDKVPCAHLGWPALHLYSIAFRSSRRARWWITRSTTPW
mmetsp:Transcript_65975/g.172881  ORF Transcript_65975/g.172881 Transcript_65975/m.172881 type:complete len:225 (+) Transcript_65975:1241-1915(+)